MAGITQHIVLSAAAGGLALSPQHKSHALGHVSANPTRPAPPRQRCRRVATLAFKDSRPTSPELTKIDDARVQRMTDMVHEYFDSMLSKGNTALVDKILDENIEHKDMVRDEARRGRAAIVQYLEDVHRAYPNFWARAEQIGVADECTVFCSFEGQATDRTPMFTGVDRIRFNHDLTKILEVEIYRSNWQGAKGHEDRKKQRVAVQT